MRPLLMTAMRSEMKRTTDRSWAMNRYVRPRVFFISFSRFSTCARMETSSAEMGSSATMNSGSMTSARAMPIRWRWPPENSWGKREANSGSRPTSCRASITFSCRSFWSLYRWWLSRPSATMYSTLARSFRDAMGSWKIICTLRMTSRSSSLGILPLIFWPLK